MIIFNKCLAFVLDKTFPSCFCLVEGDFNLPHPSVLLAAFGNGGVEPEGLDQRPSLFTPSFWYLLGSLNIHWRDYCWNFNTLATWCKELTHWKKPDAGKDWSKRKRGRQSMKLLDSITHSVEMNLSNLGESGGQGSLECCSPCMGWVGESDMTSRL